MGLYLIERRDKLENAKQKLAEKHEAAMLHKESRTKLLSKEEAVRFKANNKYRSRKKYKMDRNQVKKSKMMKDCMDFVNRRNRMWHFLKSLLVDCEQIIKRFEHRI